MGNTLLVVTRAPRRQLGGDPRRRAVAKIENGTTTGTEIGRSREYFQYSRSFSGNSSGRFIDI